MVPLPLELSRNLTRAASFTGEHATSVLKTSQPVKIDLNKKLLPKQKTVQIFIIDAQGFRKTKNENHPTWEMGVTS